MSFSMNDFCGSSDDLHQVTLCLASEEAVQGSHLRDFVPLALKNLKGRYPGLKIPQHQIHADRIEILFDLHRLDEDLPRMVQSFKSEVKNLARKNGFSHPIFWRWTYDEQ